MSEHETAVTVACVWVKRNVPYSADYVTRLLSMVGRHIDRSFEFVCFTDRPTELPHAIRTLPAFAWPNLAGWWTKLELFNPAHRLGERILYLDLDTIVVGDLASIIDFQDLRLDDSDPNAPSAFALAPPGGSFKPKGFKTVRRFNSSVMVWTPSVEMAKLYTDFEPRFATESYQGGAPLWGDQDWIGVRAKRADVMPQVWFPRLSEITGPDDPRYKVVLCKKPKNHEAAKELPWVAEAWR